MAYVPGVALFAALAVGCSAGADSDANGTDSKAGTPTVTPAPPGKYLTLPAPCRAVPRSTLKDLLPGAAELPGDQQDKVFRGSAAVTYDTDRKVGCSWKADGPNATRSLSIDLERVVSYDPAVSDDDRADTVYAKKEKAAGLSASAPPGPPDEKDKKGEASEASEASGKAKDPADGDADAGATDSADPSPSGSDDASSGESTGGTPGSSSSPEEALPSRILDDLGDAAFLQDLPKKAGSTAQHHTVSVVFRTSNVVVTVRYAEQPALVTQVPDGKELQEKAQALARKLAETLSE
ncbi:lipoprotein [Streptomyces sp. CNS654]|uniref:lipoprotein n=1 Tax=Streptomyces sp. CNS654 TaxID=1506995 RepID=UPI0005174CDA|nr:lipoprotein [Streptomyces sp. CNS654]